MTLSYCSVSSPGFTHLGWRESDETSLLDISSLIPQLSGPHTGMVWQMLTVNFVLIFGLRASPSRHHPNRTIYCKHKAVFFWHHQDGCLWGSFWEWRVGTGRTELGICQCTVLFGFYKKLKVEDPQLFPFKWEFNNHNAKEKCHVDR